jgi:hypothetical protein
MISLKELERSMPTKSLFNLVQALFWITYVIISLVIDLNSKVRI